MTFEGDDDLPIGDGGPAEAAHYIKGAVHDLADLARRHRLDLLAYLLDMAHLEAEERLRLRLRALTSISVSKDRDNRQQPD